MYLPWCPCGKIALTNGEKCLWCKVAEIEQEKRDRQLKQLAKARRSRWNKHRAKKNYSRSLGPINTERKRIAALGMKKYDKRYLARVNGERVEG